MSSVKKFLLQAQSISIKLHQDSLYRNTFYLVASQVALAFLGFFFWIINARLFPAEQIGKATTLISVTSMITSFSMMGFNVSSVRFLPEEKNKNTFVNTSYAVVSISALVLSIIFLVGLPIFSPPLLFVLNNHFLVIFLIFFMMVSALNAITDSIFIALRNTQYILFIDIAVGLVKLVSPIIFVHLGVEGAFYSFASAIMIGTLLSLFFLRKFRLHFFPKININILRRVWKFSFGNYLAGLVGMLNSTLIPILITNSLGPATTAYYYMPSMILSLMNSFPRSMSSSMFAEGSHSNFEMRKLFLKSLKGIYSLMIPATLCLVFFGQYILLAFGKSYSIEGITYLRLTLVSLLISVPNYLFGTILSIRKKVRLTIFMSFFGAVVGISLTLLTLKFGLTGLGWSNIFGQTLGLCMYLILLKTGRLSSSVVVSKKLNETLLTTQLTTRS